MAHFGGGGVGEGDGDDLAWVVDFAEQAQEAAGKEIGLARAGRRLNEDRACRIERAVALSLIGSERADARSLLIGVSSSSASSRSGRSRFS